MFQDASHLLVDNPCGLYRGAAVVDLDADGRFEVVVASAGGANRVLAWNGKALRDSTPAGLAIPGHLTVGVAGADVNGDGREELYFLNSDRSDCLFQRCDGAWVNLFELIHNVEFANLTAGRSVAVLDRCGTGRYSLFVANSKGPMLLFEMDHQNRIRDLARRLGLDRATGGRALLAAPLFAGPHTDIFANNEGGPNFLFRNLGDGRFEEVAGSCGLQDAGHDGRGITLVDSDRAGQLDLVYGNWEAPHRMYRRVDRGRYRETTPASLARPSRVSTVIAADFDNDGFQELFFNNFGEPNRLLGLRGGSWEELDPAEAAEPSGEGTGAVVGDFDGDGRLELLVTHGDGEPAPISFYRVADPVGHWLRVLPLTAAGAPARGARVSLQAGGRLQLRTIDAGSGYLSQMEPVAHFGLGGLEVTEQVSVLWPDGARRDVAAPRADQTLTLEHP